MSSVPLPIVRLVCLVIGISSFAGVSAAQETGPYSSARPFGTLRQQAAVQQAWLKERLEVNLPAVMRAHGVDMWVVTMREYNEDPVFRGAGVGHALLRRGAVPSTSSSTAARSGASSASRSAAPRRAACTRRTAPSKATSHGAEGRAVGHGPVAAVREAGARSDNPKSIALNISR